MTPPWWAGLAPAQATVTCQGASHRLCFREGALVALDHVDVEAERALAALGADRCTCVDLLDEWQRRSGDPQVLVAASRGPADPLAIEADPVAPPRRRPGQVPVRGGWTSYTSTGVRGAGGPPSAGADDLGTLLALGGGVPDRLVATVVERLSASDPADVRLRAALYGRALSSLQGWLGNALPSVELDVVEGSAGAGIVEGSDGDLRVALPVSWLNQVWARGLAVVAGRFCLSAETDDGCSFRLQAVAPDLSDPVTVVLDLSSPA